MKEIFKLQSKMSDTRDAEISHFTYTIRAYSPPDREKVREICCDTGYLGEPIDEVFEDRKWFADLNISYYLKYEPESCFVAEVNQEIIGYITGSKYPLKHAFTFYLKIAVPLFLKAFVKCVTCSYSKKSRTYLKKLVFRGSTERARRPKRTAHFHINVREGYRMKGVAKSLVRSLFLHFLDHHIHSVHAELFYSDRIRPERFYRHYGFKIFDKRPTLILENKKGPLYTMSLFIDLKDERAKSIWKL